jgi:diguanylate cyclase (GGDEF)-like protein
MRPAPHNPQPAGRIVARVLIAMVPFWLLGAAAHAACPDLPGTETRQLDALVSRNARQALGEIQQKLTTLRSEPYAPPERLATLYALQASAYSMLELDRDAREAATQGLLLAPVQTDPVHVNLLIGYWQNIYDQAGLDQAVENLDAARQVQHAGSSADICLLTARGIVQMRRNQPDLAITDLTQAYRATMNPALAGQRVQAAAALASVMRFVGDYNQALALNQEVVDWDSAHDATLDLSVARFLRGQILAAMGDYSSAIEQLGEARTLSVAVNDEQGVAFADQAACSAHIELHQLSIARSECEQALRTFVEAQSTDVVKQTQSQLAEIDLAEDHPTLALARLNGVLDNDGADMPARDLVRIYHLRARTNAELHDYPRAYQDLDTYLRRYTSVNDAERTRQITALRAQLETDRAIERNGALQRELELSRERSETQSAQLKWARIATAAGIAIIALLTYILVAGLKYRKLLVRLATHDGLTGLPNRRRTTELANEALRTSNAADSSLTMALIDFDHFKEVNDRCGHATGDFVLREFARLTRPALRAGDTLGRWGGEEFLLLLPDCTLDSAFEIVERLRAVAVEIKLPATAMNLRVSVSAGLATNVERSVSLDEIVASADVALYEAKTAGRDLIRIARASICAASSGVRRALPQELSATNPSQLS